MQRCDVRQLLENDWHGGGVEGGPDQRPRPCQEYRENNLQRKMKEDKSSESTRWWRPATIQISRHQKIRREQKKASKMMLKHLHHHQTLMFYFHIFITDNDSLSHIPEYYYKEMRNECFTFLVVVVCLIIFGVWRSDSSHLSDSCCIISQRRPAVPSLDD